jgi:N5-(cytidine 5'-diphosphoramidyl)-L-glutamine hydrolase
VSARVAITQRVVDLPERNERRDALDQAWTPWLAAAGFEAVPVPNCIADPVEYVAGLDVVALVLSGGNDLADLEGARDTAPERDALEHALLEHAAAIRLPVLGVCRGLQQLVSRWGGSLVRVDGHVARPHDLVVLDDRLPLRPGPVNSFHDWAVPPGGAGALVALATAPDGTVEAVAHPDLPQAAVMWHPERATDNDADRALLLALVERS